MAVPRRGKLQLSLTIPVHRLPTECAAEKVERTPQPETGMACGGDEVALPGRAPGTGSGADDEDQHCQGHHVMGMEHEPCQPGTGQSEQQGCLQAQHICQTAPDDGEDPTENEGQGPQIGREQWQATQIGLHEDWQQRLVRRCGKAAAESEKAQNDEGPTPQPGGSRTSCAVPPRRGARQFLLAATLFFSTPIFEISISTRSPALRKVPVVAPTPETVPVLMMSPASSVMIAEM